MDVGNKTLSQLSDEAKEKRYVALETGAKISGYTKEYLERLCRLNKLEYRLWNHGEFVVELSSLLAETHAILLSYEDINFVEKNLLEPQSEPTVPTESLLQRKNERSTKETAAAEAEMLLSEKVAEGITQPVPSFMGVNQSVSQGGRTSPFSLVGHAVVSNPTSVSEKTTDVAPAPAAQVDQEKKAELSSARAAKMWANAVTPPAPPHSSSHVPIMGTSDNFSEQREKSSADVPVHMSSLKAGADKVGIDLHSPVVHLGVTRPHVTTVHVEAKNDEWDAMLLDGHTLPAAPVSTVKSEEQPLVVATPFASPYHPIKTSVDVSAHHEDLPLFPVLGGVVNTTAGISSSDVASAIHHPGIPELGEDRRVVVFLPEKFAGKVAPEDAETHSTTIFPKRPFLVVPHAPRVSVASIGALPVVAPEALVPDTRSVPSMRVMQQDMVQASSLLPITIEEHQLVLREKYPLAKSVGFNLAFALVFAGTGALAVVGSLGNTSFVTNSVSYIAGVGAALTPNLTSASHEAAVSVTNDQNTVLPFSDEIIVATGTVAHSLLVQPVFRDSAGSAHEYTIPDNGQ